MKLAQPLASSWVDIIIMYYVYLLKDPNDKLYIGYSNNLKRRMHEHLKEKTYTTRRMIKPRLIYYEAYENEERAKERERKLKQYGSSYQGLLKRLGIK